MSLTLNDLPGEWVRQAACDLDSAEEFFRGTDNGAPVSKEPSAAYAKAICRECDVRAECLAWVLADDARRIERRERTNDGVWGGLTKRERAAMREGTR